MRVHRVLVAFSILTLTLCRPAQAQPNRHVINESTARKLVRQALVALGETEHLHVEPMAVLLGTGVLHVSIMASGRPGRQRSRRSPRRPYFAVNPWTGDVWDAMGCTRITSPTLLKEQEAIWRRSQLPAEVRKAIRDKYPADCSASQGKVNDAKK